MDHPIEIAEPIDSALWKVAYMSNEGFTAADFAIFDLPEFDKRMPALKANITPKLKKLGETMLPDMRQLLGPETYLHVAQHLRRSVNPPVATWCAFARTARGYKPVVHYRVVITREGMRTVCFVEDEADDKGIYAERMQKKARTLAGLAKELPGLVCFDPSPAEGPVVASKMNTAFFKATGELLGKRKLQHLSIGTTMRADDPDVAKMDALADRSIEELEKLLPLYQLGLP